MSNKKKNIDGGGQYMETNNAAIIHPRFQLRIQ